MTTFPTKMGMTMRRFDHKLTFICNSGRQIVDSTVRVETPIGIICGDCYERKLTGLPIKTAGRKNHPRARVRAKDSTPPVMSGTETRRFGKTDPVFKRTRTPRAVGYPGCKRLHLTPSQCGREFGCESGS